MRNFCKLTAWNIETTYVDIVYIHVLRNLLTGTI